MKFAVKKDLFRGTAETTFSPDVNLTRGMLVTVLYRLEGEPETEGTGSFTDVIAGSWYEKAVIWAENNGIVKGCGNSRFCPNDDISREQTALILFRYAKYKGYDTEISEIPETYTDIDQISSYAKDAVAWANAAGLILGSNDQLMPGVTTSRAQAAAILHRFCDMTKK